MARTRTMANGDGNGHAVEPKRDEKENSENIFLFYPNLIGTPLDRILP